jgi:hypothetical protein
MGGNFVLSLFVSNPQQILIRPETTHQKKWGWGETFFCGLLFFYTDRLFGSSEKKNLHGK